MSESAEMLNKMIEVEEQRKKNEKQRKKLCEREREADEREQTLKRREMECDYAYKEIKETLSKAESVNAEIMACELPESRDKMRLAYFYKALCMKSLSSKYSETEYVKGLANILSGQQSEVSGEDEKPTGNQQTKIF